MNWFTNQVQVHQLFPLSNGVALSKTKQIGLFQWKSPKQKGNKVTVCTHQSDLPYCMESISSWVWEQPVPLWGILKGRSSGQVVLAAAGPSWRIPYLGLTNSKAPAWGHQIQARTAYCRTGQWIERRVELLGTRNSALFGKQAEREDDRLPFQRTVLPELELRFLLHWKGR